MKKSNQSRASNQNHQKQLRLYKKIFYFYVFLIVNACELLLMYFVTICNHRLIQTITVTNTKIEINLQ